MCELSIHSLCTICECIHCVRATNTSGIYFCIATNICLRICQEARSLTTSSGDEVLIPNFGRHTLSLTLDTHPPSPLTLPHSFTHSLVIVLKRTECSCLRVLIQLCVKRIRKKQRRQSPSQIEENVIRLPH